MEEKIIGKFIANEKGFGFVEIENEKQDIFIPKQFINGALNEDTVEIEIYKEKENGKRPEGKIIKIIRRNKDCLVGIFQKSRNFGFVVPDDKKFATDIFISKKDNKNARNNDKVVVQITKYPENGKKAEGKIIEILGKVDEAGVDLLSIIKEYGLPNEFPAEVIKEAQKVSKLDKNEISKRVDLRNLEMFTIDGEDAKDLDDAVYVEKLEDGNYKLIVSIADVSYYVREKSNLDKEARLRGTSVYMFDRVIPMLPVELSNGICSLNQGEDRLALTCFMEINKKGQVISSDVKKTVVNIKRRMSYTNINKIINNLDEKVIEEYKQFVPQFKVMEELALILKNKRLEHGYLNLDIPESKITLDKIGVAIDIRKYETTFANEIIEQFMLITNETIAEKFFWLEAPFVYRVHEEPEYDKILETNKFLNNIGYRIKANRDNIKPKAFSEVLEKIKGTEYEKVISTLILRTLKVARYESENRGHFGIASKYYCHFTSPIRRYSDLFIHRIISEYLEKNYNVSEDRKKYLFKKAEKYAKRSSDCEKVATKAERDGEDIKKAEFMQDKIGNEYEAIISSITNFGMFAELENTVEGIIRFEDMGEEYFIYNENDKTLIGERTNRIFRIGDKINIRVIEANKHIRKVAFELI